MKNLKYLLFVGLVFSLFSLANAQEGELYKRQEMESAVAKVEKTNTIAYVVTSKTNPEKVEYVYLNTDPEEKSNDPKKKEQEEGQKQEGENKIKEEPEQMTSPKSVVQKKPVQSTPQKSVTTTPSSTSSEKSTVEEDESVLTYNFIYLLFQKFKLTEIIE